MAGHALHERSLFPARAGMIPFVWSWCGKNLTVPRTRGDDPTNDAIKRHCKGCSPHARG